MITPASLRTSLASGLLIATGSHAQAQGTCAELNIVSLTYAAFSDTAIEVIAHASPGTFFSYPSFRLVNDLGETLTHEEVAFFGIGESEQTHSSSLLDGQTLPTSPFVGSLVFTYYGLDDLDTCVFPIDGTLCPVEPCTPFRVFLYNNGSVLDANFAWTITDEDGLTVESGTLEITEAGTQTDQDEPCLPTGAYTLHVQQVSGPSGAFTYGVMRDQYASNGPWSVFFQSQPNDLPFLFFAPCIEGTNSIEDVGQNEVDITVADELVTITRRDGTSIGAIEVMDASGRSVNRSRTNDARATIDLRSRSAGVYVLRIGNLSSNVTTSFSQRIILN
ncbi:MAG: T9SS type A sorting domain-containing protein [Flavobacteriales bacterium]